jgi:hypothetical protein
MPESRQHGDVGGTGEVQVGDSRGAQVGDSNVQLNTFLGVSQNVYRAGIFDYRLQFLDAASEGFTELGVGGLAAIVNFFIELRRLAPDEIVRVAIPATDSAIEIGSEVVTSSFGDLFSGLLGDYFPRARPPAEPITVIFSMYRPGPYMRIEPARLPISIYLANEAVHEQVEAAVDDWLASVGLAVEFRDQPVIVSWFRRMRAGIKEAVHSGTAQDAALTALHAVDTRITLYQDAQTTALLLQNLGSVIAALQPTSDAIVRAGALLIVKVNGLIQVFQLTAAQQAILDHRPYLAASPQEVIARLQLQDPVSGFAMPGITESGSSEQSA